MLRRLAALFLGLVFTSALLLHGGAGKSLEDGLSEFKRREVAKDRRFDQAVSLYKRIERFKRGSGKLNPKPDSELPGFELSDALDDGNDGFNRGRGKPNTQTHEKFDLNDALVRTTSKPKPPLKKKDSDVPDFQLSDALDDGNDGFNGGGGKPNIKPHERLTDKDLDDVIADGYKPDKGRGGDGRYDNNDDPGTGTVAETGTIAGIASALAMALIGAVSSYISYQQKKFCFNIQAFDA
ncbi:CD99 antigen-like protein 2 isoform X2 [Macrotis lagotis]|uniref:CD99 antigen-like protein 2 isoform X2 n=1 Tax=Macrotis lagotis TaxID=92651 RepID=UPI003D693276